MAETKKRSFKELGDGEKYRTIVRNAKKAGILLGSISIGAAIFAAAFKSGKTVGTYQLFEELYKACPDARAYLTKLDPAFVTTIEV